MYAKLNVVIKISILILITTAINCCNIPQSMCVDTVWKTSNWDGGKKVKDSIPICASSGRIHGEMKTYSDTGNFVVLTTNYVNGNKNGWQTYYVHNKIWIKQYYIDNKLNKYRITVDLSSSAITVDSFSKSKIIGESFYFDQTGRVINHGNFGGSSIHDLLIPIIEYNKTQID